MVEIKAIYLLYIELLVLLLRFTKQLNLIKALNKGSETSGIVSEMVIADGEQCMEVIAHLTNSIIRDGKVPKDWEESSIANFCKGKCDVLCRWNYRGLKSLEHIMKVLVRVVEK